MTITLLRGLALGLAAVPLAASPAIAKDRKPVDPNRKVCRSEVPTGSLMARSVCHTAAEWTRMDAANSAAAQDTLRRGTRQGAQQ